MTDTRKLTAPTPFAVAEPAPLRVVLALLAIYLIWGSTYLAVRVAVETIPPFMMTSARFVVAGVIVIGAMRVQGAPLPTGRQWRNAAMVGALTLAGGMGMVAYAEQDVASGLAALAVAATPLWATLFAGLFGQRSRRQEWAGLLIGFAGIVLLNLEGDLRANPLAAIALVAGSVSWAFGSIWSKRLDLPPGLMASGAQMLMGGLVLAGFSVVTGERLTGMPSTASLLAWLYLLIFGSLIAYSTYMWLLNNVRPALATSYAYINPVIAVLLGAGLANERIGALGLVAMLVILLGVGLVAFLRQKA